MHLKATGRRHHVLRKRSGWMSFSISFNRVSCVPKLLGGPDHHRHNVISCCFDCWLTFFFFFYPFWRHCCGIFFFPHSNFSACDAVRHRFRRIFPQRGAIIVLFYFEEGSKSCTSIHSLFHWLQDRKELLLLLLNWHFSNNRKEEDSTRKASFVHAAWNPAASWIPRIPYGTICIGDNDCTAPYLTKPSHQIKIWKKVGGRYSSRNFNAYQQLKIKRYRLLLFSPPFFFFFLFIPPLGQSCAGVQVGSNSSN